MPRFLQSTPISLSSPAAPEAVAVDSDVVVILAALLCALICVVGLALVARCAWIRRASASPSSAPQPCPKGLKKKTIRSLPKYIFDSSSSSSSSCSSTKTNIDCAICLAEFCQGDELRVLPQCGHRFHVCCVDTWLAAHSSCPSCRQPLLVTMCDKCGASSASASAGGGDQEPKPREDGDANRFLP